MKGFQGALVYRLLVWCGAVGYVSGLRDAPSTTRSNHLYSTLELLMMGVMVPETCWASNKFCNKEPSVASSWPFYFHVLTTMHNQTNIKFEMECVHCEVRTGFLNGRYYFSSLKGTGGTT